jgi:DNA-binding beta-propeller fold protein YncE
VITPNNPTVGQGQTLQLTAKVVDNVGAEITGLGVTWSVSNPAVATIDGNGLVTSVGPIATISVTADHQGITATVNLVITQRVVGLDVAEGSLSLHRNTSRALTVSAVDFLGDPVPVSGLVFGSSAPAVASVSTAGVVTAKNVVGSAIITVSKDAFSEQVPVTVRIATAVVQVVPASVLLAPGAQATLAVTVLDSLYAPISQAPVSFTATNPAIATVTSAGVVTSVGPQGSTTITVQSDTVETPVSVFVGTDLQGVLTQTVSLAGGSYGAAIAGNGDVFVGNVGITSVMRATITNFTFASMAPLSVIPLGMALSPDGSTLFVGNSANSSIDRFNTLSGAGLAPYTVPGGIVYSLAVTPDGSTLVAGSNSWVWILNALTGALIDSFPAADAIHVAVHPSSPLAYGSMYSAGVVIEYNWQTKASRQFPLPGTAQAVVVTPDGLELYATTEGPNVIKGWTLATGASRPDIPTGGPGFGLGATSTRLILASSSSGRIEIYDRPSRNLVNGYSVGGTPRRVAVSPDGKAAVVANEAGSVHLVQ